MNVGFRTRTYKTVHGTDDPGKCGFVGSAKQLFEVPIPWKELGTDRSAIVAYLATQDLKPCPSCFDWLFLEEREPLPWPPPAAAAEWELAEVLDDAAIERIRVGETLYLLCPRCGIDIGSTVQGLLDPLTIAKIVLEWGEEPLALACPECGEPIGCSVVQMLMTRQRLVQALWGEGLFASIHPEVFIPQMNTTSAVVLNAMQLAQERSADPDDPKFAEAPRNLEMLLHRLRWWGGEKPTLKKLVGVYGLTHDAIRRIGRAGLRRLRWDRTLRNAWQPLSPAKLIELQQAKRELKAGVAALEDTLAKRKKEIEELQERIAALTIELEREGRLIGDKLPAEIKIGELELPVWVYNSLLRAGLRTVADLLEYRAEELMRLSGFGEVALDKVRSALNNLEPGFHLRGESAE